MNQVSKHRARRYFVLILLAVAIVGGCRPQPPTSIPAVPLMPAQEVDSNGETVELILHFVHEGHEQIEKRSIPATLAVARAAILELAKGFVSSKGEQKVLPPGTRLRDIAILDGIAYVDFSREFRDNHWGSLASELDTIYSVVNTLAEFKSVRAVQFLLEGSPISTIGAGAIDLTSPVRPHKVAPEFYQELNAKLTAAAGTSLPWSSWIRREERLGFREGFPDRVVAADTDGDGIDELIFTHDKRVSIWKRQAGAFQQVWERKFSSRPRTLVVPIDSGQGYNLVVGTQEGIYIFAWENGNYSQLGWQGIGGALIDLVAGDTTGTGRGQILALMGPNGRTPVKSESTSIVIWEWNGETYIMKREVEFNAFKILTADINGNGADEILAFNQNGFTVFSWQGAAYVEIGSNPGAGCEYASVTTADLTGDGQPELIIRDGQSPHIYVYTWQQGVLRKLWQGAPTEDHLGWEIFVDSWVDGYPAIISATREPGRYFVYSYIQDKWEEKLISGSGGEEVLALADVDGDGKAEVIFRRQQLLSSPTKWIYVGWPGA
ncbi:MAG TPA: hypothetical protein GXX69_06625 [Firmicutes bacterium]|nr:hypothetical protein [Bacillota bacterium]